LKTRPSLTEPILMGGAPRSIAIVNGTLAAALGAGAAVGTSLAAGGAIVAGAGLAAGGV
jgi:type IV secretion system protein TrbD